MVILSQLALLKRGVEMSFNTARIILIIAGMMWIISLLIPYSRLGITKRGVTAIRVIMAATLIGALVVYGVFTT